MPGGVVDAFITFGNGLPSGGGRGFTIDGESDDVFEKQHKSSQIQSYTFDFNLSMDSGLETSDGDSGKNTHAPRLEAVTVTKQLDLASPKILFALCNAAVFDWVCIWQKRAGGTKGRSGDYFWKVELRQVNISNLTWTADADGMPVETIRLQYHEISVEYIPQKHTGELDKGRHQTAEYSDEHDRRTVRDDEGRVDIDKVADAVIEKLKRSKKIPGLI